MWKILGIRCDFPSLQKKVKIWRAKSMEMNRIYQYRETVTRVGSGKRYWQLSKDLVLKKTWYIILKNLNLFWGSWETKKGLSIKWLNQICVLVWFFSMTQIVKNLQWVGPAFNPLVEKILREVNIYPLVGSILAWRIPWTEEIGRLQSMGLQRFGHNWTTNTQQLSMVFLKVAKGYVCSSNDTYLKFIFLFLS